MSEVNAELYDLLKKNETGLYTQDFHKNKTVFAYVHIDFRDVDELVEVMGSDYWSEGGVEARIMPMSVCVEVNDMIEHFGHSLSDYKRCFCEDDWKQFEDFIKQMEA